MTVRTFIYMLPKLRHFSHLLNGAAPLKSYTSAQFLAKQIFDNLQNQLSRWEDKAMLYIVVVQELQI